MPRVKVAVAPAVPEYASRGVEVHVGDLLDVVPRLGRFDAVVTDSPYGLTFMGADWDRGVPGERFWRVLLRASKPGAHLLAFGGTRTFHRLTSAIEDAGWEIRDCLSWLYGTGFPKSLDVSKAIDRKLGGEREVVARGPSRVSNLGPNGYGRRTNPEITRAATDAARRWEGWGTALKPAWEPVVLARRPLEGTVAENVLRWGVGALHVDACRVGTSKRVPASPRRARSSQSLGDLGPQPLDSSGFNPNVGRWPANVAHDGSEDVLEGLPGDSRRFFYRAKVSRAERGPGNDHPTVKPVALMRWLLRLVVPPGGRVLDPFAGSGSTLLAARAEGLRAVGVELEPRYAAIAVRRLRTKVVA